MAQTYKWSKKEKTKEKLERGFWCRYRHHVPP